MFITIAYKDDPELSTYRRRSSDSDLSVEKTLLVNPVCYVRVMLEYIRKACKLGSFTCFDLCDDTGVLKGLFSLPTYTYANDMFEHKKTYYVVVMKQEIDRRISIIPQINRQNRLYPELRTKIWSYTQTPDYVSPMSGGTPSTAGGGRFSMRKSLY